MAEKLNLEVNSHNYMVFDFSTTRDFTASNLNVAEPYTAVSYGDIVIVTMCDLNIEVRMDPPSYGNERNWEDGKYARDHALKAIKDNLPHEMWADMFRGLLEIGKAQGREGLQKEFRQLLG